MVIAGDGEPLPETSNRVLAGTALLAQTHRATAAGVKRGPHLLPPEALHAGNRGKQRVSFVVPALRTPLTTRLALQFPRVGEGASGTLSALGHALLQIPLDELGPPAGKGV